jgi:hypothetical protein
LIRPFETGKTCECVECELVVRDFDSLEEGGSSVRDGRNGPVYRPTHQNSSRNGKTSLPPTQLRLRLFAHSHSVLTSSFLARRRRHVEVWRSWGVAVPRRRGTGGHWRRRYSTRNPPHKQFLVRLGRVVCAGFVLQQRKGRG